MSASAATQLAIAQKLAASHSTTLGDGVSSVFPIAHGLGSKFLYLSANAGETTLVNGDDFSIAFTSQDAIALTALGGAPAAEAWSVKLTPLRVTCSPMGGDYVPGTVPIVARRTREKGNDVEAAMALRVGLTIFVMPVMPKGVMRGVPFLFYERAEIRVRIIEVPAMNVLGADAYELMEDVMNFLQWQMFTGHQHPIEALDPEMVEGVSESEEPLLRGQLVRIIDCPFAAHFGQQPATAGTS